MPNYDFGHNFSEFCQIVLKFCTPPGYDQTETFLLKNFFLSSIIWSGERLVVLQKMQKFDEIWLLSPKRMQLPENFTLKINFSHNQEKSRKSKIVTKAKFFMPAITF